MRGRIQGLGSDFQQNDRVLSESTSKLRSMSLGKAAKIFALEDLEYVFSSTGSNV